MRRKPIVDAESAIPTLNGIVGTDQQAAIWREGLYGHKHMIVKARAGTGKTFSMVHQLNLATALGLMPRSAAFCAFTRVIGQELQAKVPEGVRAGTIHSFGFAAIRRWNPKIKVESDKLDYLLEDMSLPPTERVAVRKLAGLCKNTLMGDVTGDGGDWDFSIRRDELEELTDKYSVDFPEKNWRMVHNCVEELLTSSLNDERRIDQDDMIWLPVVKELSCWRNDWLFVDEYQDLNATQRKLITRLGSRLFVVGDEYQAIFGFRGADYKSCENTREMLEVMGGYEELPLTKTRRCPKSHVREVQHLVPDFEAMGDAPEGKILWEEGDECLQRMEPADMTLCRTNAPLIAVAFSLLRLNKRVKVLGRDIGKNLMSLIEKLAKASKSSSTEKIAEGLVEYKEKEEARIRKKKYGITDKLIALSDKVKCAHTFLSQSRTLDEVRDRMKVMFSESGEEANRGAVILSSIHKAKGLEADVTRILRPDLLPHPMADSLEELQQESNCEYVAKTRSKGTMIYVAPQKEQEVPWE